MKGGHCIIAASANEEQGLEKLLEKRIPFLHEEGHTNMFAELSKENCKAIRMQVAEEWWNIQEAKMPGSNSTIYGEYAEKAWAAAQKSDAEMKRRRAAGEKVKVKSIGNRYKANMRTYFKTHIDKLFGSNFVLDYLICFGVCTPAMIAAKNIVDENRRKLYAESCNKKLPHDAHEHTTKVSARRLAEHLGRNPPPVMGERPKLKNQSQIALSYSRLYDKQTKKFKEGNPTPKQIREREIYADKLWKRAEDLAQELGNPYQGRDGQKKYPKGEPKTMMDEFLIVFREIVASGDFLLLVFECTH